MLITEAIKINYEFNPFIITGDFNASPLGEVRRELTKHLPNLRDPWFDFNKEEECTFHKFDGIDPTGKATRIDWLLHTDEINCTKIELIKKNRGELYPSDHFFVHGTLDFKS